MRAAISSFKHAFSGWGVVLAVVAAALVALNLLRKVVDLGLSQVLGDVIATYQRWVHEPIQWLFRWMSLPALPGWVIDASALWLLFGGVTVRAVLALRKARALSADVGVEYGDGELLDLIYLSPRWKAFPIIMLFWLLVVPLIVERALETRSFNRDIGQTETETAADADAEFEDYMLDFGDADLQLLWQLVGLIAFLGGVLALNLVAKTYGF